MAVKFGDKTTEMILILIDFNNHEIFKLLLF